MEEEIYIPPEGPPTSVSVSKEIYGIMGPENIFKMCEDFYLSLETTAIRPMFPADLVEASKKQALFLIGLMGGPPLYQKKYGHPRLRARHIPFAIDEAARLVWLNAFKKTLESAAEAYQFPAEHLPGFIDFLEQFSAWMVNKE